MCVRPARDELDHLARPHTVGRHLRPSTAAVRVTARNYHARFVKKVETITLNLSQSQLSNQLFLTISAEPPTFLTIAGELSIFSDELSIFSDELEGYLARFSTYRLPAIGCLY
jgi:hypothetical protein